MVGYHDEIGFKHWCKEVLPDVYDENLNFWELMKKVAEYVKETSGDLTEIIAELVRVNNALETKVNVEAVAGVYDDTSTYAVGDYCMYDGTLYECITAIETAENWTAAHWKTAEVMENISEVKDSLDDIEEEISSITGISDEVKEALLDCFAHTAWIDGNGQVYYNELYEALYGEPNPLLYRLASPFYSGGNESVDTGAVLQQNTGKYTICFKFIVALDSSDNTPVSVLSYKYLNAGGNYYIIKVNKKVESGNTYRLLYGWGIPYEASGVEGKYTLGAVYSVVIAIDTDAMTSTTYVYDTHSEITYTYEKELNPAYLFNNDQCFVLGKEKYETITNGFIGMIDNLEIKRQELSSTEITNYLESDIAKENIEFEIGDVSASTGENVAQPLRIRTKGYIELPDNAVTTVGCPFAETWALYGGLINNEIQSVHAFRCFDSSKNYLSSVSMLSTSAPYTSKSLPSGTKYIRVVMQKDAHTQYSSGFASAATYPYYINGKSYRLVEA